MNSSVSLYLSSKNLHVSEKWLDEWKMETEYFIDSVLNSLPTVLIYYNNKLSADSESRRRIMGLRIEE